MTRGIIPSQPSFYPERLLAGREKNFSGKLADDRYGYGGFVFTIFSSVCCWTTASATFLDSFFFFLFLFAGHAAELVCMYRREFILKFMCNSCVSGWKPKFMMMGCVCAARF